MTSSSRRVLGTRDLVFFNIAAVIGIRWLAAAAHTGPGSITLWILAAVLFFVPSALAVSSLARLHPEEGGLYVWTRRSFGDWHGFLCGWCYWLSNLFYFPQLILVGLSASLFALGPSYQALTASQPFMLSASLVLLWAALFTHIVGLKTGRWTGILGGLCTYAVGVAVIGFGLVGLFKHGSMTPLDIRPHWDLDRLNFWSQIAFAFGGLELGAVMGAEIRNPERTVARAAWISGGLIAVFYILGTISVLSLLKPEQVDVVNGLAQMGRLGGGMLGIGWMAGAIGVLILIGALGQLGAWAGGSARLPSVMGVDRYLPSALGRIHPKWGTPYVSLIFQGVVCSIFLVATQLGESFRTGYQLLVDMCVISYFIPFAYLFLSASRLTRSRSAWIGFGMTLLGLAFALLPPGDVASAGRYELKLLGGTLALILAGRLCFVIESRRTSWWVTKQRARPLRSEP